MSVLAQETQEEKIQQAIMDREQAERSQILQTMDRGVALMEDEKYTEANALFKDVLAHVKVVPTELCFYFGKNSYHLGKYRQSIDWLNKYIELKGTTGQYFDECSEYLEKAKQGFVGVQKEEREEVKNILSINYDIDCGPSGMVICPVCQGKGVIITKGQFRDTYKTCPYSNDHGLLTCEEYNQLLRGELKPKL
ncbi:hypothetical protein LVD15_25695 [Fulvivirga maritima]|uniref:hypothetical protein n=1 Tax=Fulvivirga maritima TaxID=2904247 RepID=UPI001F174722|nr:hypothetical protein [Fulvivirga maritima]UII26648.1 hypothetical protein LVD15_25695 [Fulvivirga maritima]